MQTNEPIADPSPQIDNPPATNAELLQHILRTFEGESGRATLAWLHATAGTRKSSFWPGAGGTCCPIAAAKRDGGKTLVWAIEAKLAEARAAAGDPNATGKPKAVAGQGARSKRQG